MKKGTEIRSEARKDKESRKDLNGNDSHAGHFNH
jgi:hypothetical protein